MIWRHQGLHYLFFDKKTSFRQVRSQIGSGAVWQHIALQSTAVTHLWFQVEYFIHCAPMGKTMFLHEKKGWTVIACVALGAMRQIA
jgi:hypothetical protein